jgi:putative FmdB family regulatory protein
MEAQGFCQNRFSCESRSLHKWVLEDQGREGQTVPTYEFRCEDCKRVFTLVMSMAERDKGKVSCPGCKKKT